MLEQLPRRKHLKMLFPISTSPNTVESATLRLLLPPQHNDSTVINVRVNQILGARRRKLLQEETFYLSENLTKWCETDVTNAVSSWMKGRRNLGLELECVGCRNNLRPKVAAITALVQSAQRRIKREADGSEKRESDCVDSRHTIPGRTKKKFKCCRHSMRVEFKKLGYLEMKNVNDPISYDAGYCQGLCPPDYSVATNHSRIQGLLHKYTKRDARQNGNKTNIVPKTCCTPSKLKDLQVLMIDPQNPTKLKVETWTNMIIEECACS